MKRILAWLLSLMIVMSLFPAFTMNAAASSEDIGSMNALDALGIDTSKMPEGYDPNSTSNPYGQDSVTVNPVYELFVSKTTKAAGTPVVDGTTTTVTDTYTKNTTIYGNNKALNQSTADFYGKQGESAVNTFTNVTVTDSKDASSNSATIGMESASVASASGNFVGPSQAGKKAQVVTVAAGALTKNGGLYLYFTDPVTGSTGNVKTLLDTTGIIGNGGNKMEEDFATSAYLMKNYLKIAAGDFDNDGVDEAAVYVPEQGKSRVEIYKLEIETGALDDTYMSTGKWIKVWTYYFNESPYVSNMVSLTSGDFTRDGTDDLALTWGYYYGPDSNNACQAVILYGGSSNMLQVSKKLNLSYNNTNIVRAAFAYGDIDGDNINDLVLGGELSSDLASGNGNSRFVAVYSYEGTTDSFIQNTAVNFDLFHKEDNQYVNTVMSTHGDKFYSVPACVTNIATVNMNGVGKAAYIYIDSLLIENGNTGLTIAMALDQNTGFNKNTGGPQKYYTEYGVTAADFTGSGKETLQVMQCYTPIVTATTETRYLNWFYELFGIANYVVTYHAYPSDIDMMAVYGNTSGITVGRTNEADSSTAFCKVNTDNDTSLLSYTGKHYVRYTDPKVL
ncbi:MAG: hypothetical protein HGA22_04305, partial [Clostridiales bacterium]|nr:hypothetical protein [Clostridiales bacterium]